MIDREAISVALFERLRAVPGIKTADRFFRGWDEVGEGDQPALYVIGGTEVADVKDRGRPTVWRVQHRVFLYTRTDASRVEPGSTNQNTLLTAIEKALEADPTQGDDLRAFNTTLGGLVSRAYITGEIIKDEGTEGGQGVAVLTVEYLAGA